MALTLILRCISANVASWIAAFVFFRCFDILKLWPIWITDARLKNGFGVMFDDLLATCSALAIFYLGGTPGVPFFAQPA